MTASLRWLTHAHTERWHAHYQTAGTGHLYQGRFRAFAIQEDDHLLRVLRYVERNPLRAGLVRPAENWRWSSLGHWHARDSKQLSWLCEWPIARPRRWLEYVNGVETEAELEALRRSANRERPFGTETWEKAVAGRLGLQHTMRPRGRPKKAKD